MRTAYQTTLYSDGLIDSAQIQKYFKLVGRNEKSISTVFWLTSDRIYLEELQSFRDSPRALEIIAHFCPDAKIAGAAAMRLIELEPSNPFGHYLAAKQEILDGNLTGALDSLDRVSQLEGNMSNANPENYRSALDALGIMGFDDTEAHFYLWNHGDIFTRSHQALREMADTLLKPGDNTTEDQIANSASKLLGICIRTSGDASLSTGAMMQSIRNELEVLKALPPDFEYGDSKTVGARMPELKDLYKNESHSNEKLDEILKISPPDQVDEYVRLVDEKGTVDAREWLFEENGG